jgi:L-malate glycosyltransferase
MKTILSISHYNKLYGANKSLLALIEGTKHEINWIIVCRQRGELMNECRRLNIKAYYVPFFLDITTRKKSSVLDYIFFIMQFGLNIFFVLILLLLFKIHKPKVIHSNSSVTIIGAIASSLSSLPHVWHIREFGLEDYDFRYRFGDRFFCYWANNSRLIVAISESIKKICILQRKIVAPHLVIYNGVISESFLKKCLSHKVLNRPAIIISVGLLHEGKNQFELIKAVEYLNKDGDFVQLKIIGDCKGTYYEMLNDYVLKNNLQDTVHFAGFISKPFETFKHADVHVLCSKNEGFGRVTVESMAYGIPVIAFDGGGTREIITSYESGILYSESYYELAQAIKVLIQNETLYNKIRMRAFTLVNKYTIEKYAQIFLESINKVT